MSYVFYIQKQLLLIINITNIIFCRFLSFLFPQVDQKEEAEATFNYDQAPTTSGFENESNPERYTRSDSLPTDQEKLDKEYEQQLLDLNALINSRRR